MRWTVSRYDRIVQQGMLYVEYQSLESAILLFSDLKKWSSAFLSEQTFTNNDIFGGAEGGWQQSSNIWDQQPGVKRCLFMWADLHSSSLGHNPQDQNFIRFVTDQTNIKGIFLAGKEKKGLKGVPLSP